MVTPPQQETVAAGVAHRALGAAMRTGPGARVVEFMRSDRGKQLDKWLVRRTGRSLLMKLFSAKVRFPPMPVLLLHTVGRKSGEPRSTVMPFVPLDDRLYLIGSNGAKPRDPFWVDNLRERPDAEIDVHRVRRRVRARIVGRDTDEYARLMTAARRMTPQYDTYQTATARPLPVVALEGRS